MALDPVFSEVLPWLKTLPLAPEYHPTLVEFQDPIAYILKIEQEASRYGICKIVPPVPAVPKAIAVTNLNLSFSARSPSGDPTFTTRQQQIGFCPRRPRPVQKSVWQEAKARSFERAHLRKCRKKNKSSSSLSPIEVESLFWKTAADKPSSVEYANDIPGSGFSKLREEEIDMTAAENVGETAWNMRGVARAKGSLLRFMKEEIPGVTSPMVYVAMLFSWFAWHVEDHDLHSLNFLHMGAGKTWYGVPRDAALAFEEVVRVHGYGGEVNPLITFATLAEKTTLMSPEVLIGSGIPCCRLVQNAGEFVVTFPGSYHSGFSHGFNCGEASNIATPEWLKVAKEAAIRRASTNCPPMVSHYQLLYALALSLHTRNPSRILSMPKSSRLKNKLRCVGETMIKKTFVQNVIRNNSLLNILLDDGSSCLILPRRTFDKPLCSGLHRKLQMKVKPRKALDLCHGEDKMEEISISDFSIGSRRTWDSCSKGFCQAEENSEYVYHRKNLSTNKISCLGSSGSHNLYSETQNMEGQNNEHRTDGVLDQGLLSCVTCGILSYSCVAVIQPSEAAAECLISCDYNSYADHITGFEENCGLNDEAAMNIHNSDVDINPGQIEKINSSVQVPFSNDGLLSNAKVERETSALDLLASAYGDLSDSEEYAFHDVSFCADGNNLTHSSLRCILDQQSVSPNISETLSHEGFPSNEGEAFSNANYQDRTPGICSTLYKFIHCSKKVANSSLVSKLCQLHGNDGYECSCEDKMTQLSGNQQDTIGKPTRLVDHTKMTTHSFSETLCDQQSPDASINSFHQTVPTKVNLNDMMTKNIKSDSSVFDQPGSSYGSKMATGNTFTTFGHLDDSINNSKMTVVQPSDKDSYRMHVFCLEHAVDVEKRLRALGGVNLMLLCHPEYPKIESEAKLLAEELGLHYQWKDVKYKDASQQDQEKIRIAIEDKDVIPCNGDWAVKLGINLYYSVSLSQSPLFRKQLPYNEVIYKSFSQKSPTELNSSGTIARRQKKIIFAGRWCGKVWMSNQVHPYLAEQNLPDDDDNIYLSLETDSYRESGNQEILYKRKSSIKKAADRRKSDKKKAKSEYIESARNAARAVLDKFDDARYEENPGLTGKPDSDTDIVACEANTDIDDHKQAILPRRNSKNGNSLSRRKFDKMKKATVRSSTRKPVHTGLNSSDDLSGDDNSGNADGDQDSDRSEAGAYMVDDKLAILSRRNSKIDDASARRKAHQKGKKSAVISNTLKHAHTIPDNCRNHRCAKENSQYSKNSDGDQDTDRSHADADIESDRQTIIQQRNLKINNAAARRRSDKKRKSIAVRSNTRKPVRTQLVDSGDAGCAESIGNTDDEQDRNLSSEADTDSENKKKASLLRRNLPNNNAAAMKKSGRKRKRSKASCIRKAAHTRPDSSAAFGYAEDDISIKCGRSLKCLRSHSKGTSGEPPSLQPCKGRFNYCEATVVVAPEKQNNKRKIKKAHNSVVCDKENFSCDVEGCSMSFRTKHDLTLHKRNVCPEKGCGKKFFSHKYLLQHRKVHSDDRPLKCPWKGCKMTFKWAWARTEHIRVHTGERPYSCREPGCELTFRFVSDFSRHRRKTGH
ncbi:lysine-specific demethylase JMJ705-like [Phalaenopsis equestris]|uniref:lysine-specific demethylase JMJ705-like n=1 Tax=Phalaenopsis equestris TaxID=78828 RepID=UPI0009E4F1E8|nr:lysine-specific demethylase JMJ705-like [Phalaenopsis equestris]